MRKYFRFLTLSFIFISLLSCGIPTYSIVEAPVRYEGGETTSVGFYAPSDDTSINNYMIYYKLYIEGDTNISSDKNEIEDNSSSVGSTLLNNLKFNQINIGTETETINTITFLSIYTDSNILQAGDLLEIKVTPGVGSVEIDGSNVGVPLRNVIESDYYKTFSNNVDNDDTDRNTAITGTPYTISFVAFSSVFDIIGTSEDSIPVFLGTLTVSN